MADDDIDDQTEFLTEFSYDDSKRPGSTATKINSDHSRVILHFDIDCFYAQVEMIKDPSLREKPMGIQQKNIVVTCNYKAREFGVTKCAWIRDALKICPKLVLVNGEDLHDYRKFSQRVFSLLQGYGVPVERMGMDENFIDVTKLVDKTTNSEELHGFTYEQSAQPCACGCHRRLKIGSALAAEMRRKIFEEVGLTSSAGVAHNKVLAKLVSSCHKPNKQTTIFPESVPGFMANLSGVRAVPGIGSNMTKVLKDMGIESIAELQRVPLEALAEQFDADTAQRIKGLGFGRDDSEVKMSGLPQSIGLEDRFKMISSRSECREKLKWLLGRLSKLLYDDGRQPQVIKVTVRDYYKDKEIKKFHKESRQCKISPTLFNELKNSDELDANSGDKILDVCLELLSKMVNFQDQFHLTLMGLAVTDFVKQPCQSIAAFFQKSSDPVKRKQSNADCLTVSKHSKIDPDVLKELPKDIADEISRSGGGSVRAYTEKCLTETDIPQGWDREVFSQLPKEIQKELIADKASVSFPSSSKKKKSGSGTILNYFKRT